MAIGLSYIPVSMLRHIPFIKAFLHESLLDFAKGFFCIYWDDHVVFVFASITMLCYMYDLHMLNNSCIPGKKSTLLQCMIFLIWCWIQFANILLGIFASMLTREIGLYFSYFVVFLSGLGSS
jgi:hypothetical protein